MTYDNEFAHRVREQLAISNSGELMVREGLATKRQLGVWVRRGVAFARTLPAKG